MNDVDQSGKAASERRPCPICGKPASKDAAPFCSRRCADVDLNRWLGGVYAVPASDSEEDDDGVTPSQDCPSDD